MHDYINVLDGPLYQWDVGREVEIKLPDGETATVADFSRDNEGSARVVEIKNGKAEIPNDILQQHGTLRVWAVSVSDGRITRHSASFAITRRAKPDNYIYTPTEILDWRELEHDINELAKRVDEIDQGGSGGIANETDPTVPEWAKQPEKPRYTAEEVGALSQSELETGVDAALAKAKASGEFDGKSGVYTGPDEPTDPSVNVWIDTDGDADAQIPEPYTLPTASAEVKGGVKIGEGLQMDGDVLGVVPDGEYELIEIFTIEEDSIQHIIRSNLFLNAMILAIECPIAATSKDAHCSVRGNNLSIFTGGELLNKQYAQSARYTFAKKQGLWDATFVTNPPGWGGGNYKAQGRAGKVQVGTVMSTITYFDLYTTGEATFPVGMIVEIWGVRANA